MSLIKNARGLPRFMADCGFWRHPRWRGSSLQQMGLYVACLSYCYEHETDGLIPGPDPEDMAVALGVRIRDVEQALPGLLERGSLVAHDDHLEVASFVEHNPSKAEIADYRERRSAAGKRAASARWERDAYESDSEKDANRTTERNASGENIRASVDADFDAWWSEWPRKVDRKDALGAYRARRREGVTHERLLTARNNYITAKSGTEARYIKHGASFLAKDGPWQEWEHGTPQGELAAIVLPPKSTNGEVRMCKLCSNTGNYFKGGVLTECRTHEFRLSPKETQA